MVYRINLLVILAIFATAGLPLQAQQKDYRTSLLAEADWVRLRIVSGQLISADSKTGESQSAESSNPLVGIQERISLSQVNGQSQLRYQLTDREQSLAVDFLPDKQVHIVRQPQAGSIVTPLDFSQQADGRVTLLLGTEANRVELHGDSFWHLLMAADEKSSRELLEVLHTLRPNWQLSHTVEGIQRSLYRLAESNLVPDRDAWQELIGQLGSKKFAQRLSAEQKLLASGPAVLPFLRKLSRRQLDTQQRWHVDHLLKQLSADIDDSPERVASWLIDDPQVWLTLLEQAEGGHRQLAHSHLSRLLNHEIEFDPKADETARRLQLKRLQQQIATLPRK